MYTSFTYSFSPLKRQYKQILVCEPAVVNRKHDMQNPLPSLACQLRPTSVAMPELFSMIFSQSSKDVTRPIKFDGEGGGKYII